MDERCQVACEFRTNTAYMMPIVVDTMSNQFDELFGAWPVRFFIVKNNVLVFKVILTKFWARGKLLKK
jgi:hypothetical protein